MEFVRTFPRAHLMAWALIIALSLFATLTSKVEGRTAEPPDTAPSGNAIGPIGDLPSFCYSWRTHREMTQFWSGYAGFPHVFVDWQVRYNGCDVELQFANCTATTTVISVAFTWCGGWWPDSTHNTIHIGANWAECSSPIPTVGLVGCWSGYVRQHARNDGYMRSRIYWQQEPIGGWVWNSPY